MEGCDETGNFQDLPDYMRDLTANYFIIFPYKQRSYFFAL